MATITNAKNVPLNARTGTVPNMSGALQGWFQPMTFTLIAKITTAFQLVETPENISFRGVIQPMQGKTLYIKPIGQRSWNWSMVHSDTCLPLEVDDVVLYLGKQMRVMALKDYLIYGYYYYELVVDWTGSGPN